MTCAFVIGDSHTVCLSRAVGAYPHMGCISVHRFASKRSIPDDGSISLNTAVSLIKRLPPTVPVFLSIIGGFHNILGLVRQDVEFDFLPGSGATTEDLDDVNVIPRRVLAGVLDSYIESAEKYLILRQAARGAVFLIGTPPPKESDAFIIEKFSKAKKRDYRGRNVIEIGLSTPRFRQKFWALECERSRKWAENHGMSYLPAPTVALTEKKFLLERYYEDATHANPDYGMLVLEQIMGIVSKYKEDVAHG